MNSSTALKPGGKIFNSTVGHVAGPAWETLRAGDTAWRIRDRALRLFLETLSLPFSVFLSQSGHPHLKEGKKKSLWEIRLSDPEKKTYLVKVYRNTAIPAQVKDLFRGSKAGREFEAALEVARRGIPTFLPAAAGEKRRNGLVRESYLVIEKVERCSDLAKYLLRAEGETGDLWERRSVIADLGSLTRKICDLGVLQRDLALNNFLIARTQAGEPSLFFSDYEKVRLLPSVPESLRLKELSKLNRVGLEVSLGERLRFLRAYLSPEPANRERRHELTRSLQSQTLETLLRDGLRGRMTSVHTDRFYITYRDGTFLGYYRDGYRVEEILEAIRCRNSSGGKRFEIELRGAERGVPVMVKSSSRMDRAISMEKLWSRAFTLALGTLPVILPIAFQWIRTFRFFISA